MCYNEYRAELHRECKCRECCKVYWIAPLIFCAAVFYLLVWESLSVSRAPVSHPPPFSSPTSPTETISSTGSGTPSSTQAATRSACPSAATLSTIQSDGCSFLNGTTAAIFLHTFPSAPDTKAWREIFEDQIATLLASPLTACGVLVYVGTPLGTPWPLSYTCGAEAFLRPYTPSIQMPVDWVNGLWEEERTLSSLYEYCSHPTRLGTDLVAYIHDKGTRWAKAKDPARFQYQWDWRKMMEYFILEHPQGCVSALRSGEADACGSEFVSRDSRHFSGNEWWATCAQVRRQGHPIDASYSKRKHDSRLYLDPEFWILHSGGRPRNCWSSQVVHYSQSLPRERYEGRRCDARRLAVNFLPSSPKT
jgi:hypothetical protein